MIETYLFQPLSTAVGGGGGGGGGASLLSSFWRLDDDETAQILLQSNVPVCQRV